MVARSGFLDECGVCDGNSTSCDLHMVLDVKVNAPLCCVNKHRNDL